MCYLTMLRGRGGANYIQMYVVFSTLHITVSNIIGQGYYFKKLFNKEGNVLFNYALNTFYLRLYGVGHMIKDHSDSEKGNPLLPQGLLFLNSSKGSLYVPSHRQNTT